MNNKLFARIAVAVICICMMSTVAFAADPTFTPGDETATLSFNVGTDDADITVSSEDQITMMAYLVDGTVETVANIPDYTNQTVVALNQVDGAEGFGEVLIAASKLEEGKKIAVVLGGSDGTTEKFLVAQEVISGGETIVTVMNGATAINLTADAAGNVTLPTTATFDKASPAGYTFVLYSWVTEDGANEYKVADAPVVAATALEGKTLYAKFVCNRPYGDVDDNGQITLDDYGDILRVVNGRSARKKTGKLLIEGVASYVTGDVDGTATITLDDYGDVLRVVNGRSARKNTGKPIYYVNK